jgi:hypothetical protein
VEENAAEEFVQLVDFEEGEYCEETIENEHVEENIIEEMGSVRRRHWRMTLSRRMMLRRLMLKRLCRWWIIGRRGS